MRKSSCPMRNSKEARKPMSADGMESKKAMTTLFLSLRCPRLNLETRSMAMIGMAGPPESQNEIIAPHPSAKAGKLSANIKTRTGYTLQD